MIVFRIATIALAVLAALACGSSSPPSSGTSHAGSSPGMSSAMPGMNMGGQGNGLASSVDGFTFASSISTLAPGTAQDYRFRIMGQAGRPHTTFSVDQTKLMHFYAIRADLTGYRHLHPSMASDGTWSTALPLKDPGPYRVFASFIAKDSAGKDHPLVLSRELMVPGSYQPVSLPPPSESAEVDGYLLTLQGQMMHGMSMPFTVRVTRGGQPVADLEPYLDTYAHVTAFRSPNLAFTHLHPEEKAQAGGHGGPQLTFDSELPEAGDYWLFVQFQTQGQLHTGTLTVRAG